MISAFARINLLFKMAGGEECESLFSLEVIVETVENICVSCYKPTIAFRLLDFPTVVICPERQGGLSRNEVSYEIQSGKSCLFKMSKEMLCERLENTPLYIMLVDTSFEKTKLLASTTISLLSCFQTILSNIENNGLDVPAVSGSKGEFPMYNLMGSQVATVNLGYRMFSFGVGMTGHVNLSLSKQIKRSENILTELPSQQPEMAGKENGQFKQPSSSHEENGATSNRKPVIPDIVEENRTLQTDAHTQTDNINTKQQSVTPPLLYNNPESFSVHHHKNISRPPPLYYNSTSTITKPRVMPISLGRLVNSNNDLTKLRTQSASVKNPNKEINSRPQYCDTSVRTCEISYNVPTQRNDDSTRCLNDNQLSLPLIEALLNELSLVRTKFVGNDLPQQINEGSTSHCKNEEVKIFETGHVLSQKAQPQDQKIKKMKVAHPQTKKSIPTRATSKGVLISRHPIKFKKSSLKYGTTRTQKLREAINKNIHSEQNLEQTGFQKKGEFLRQDNNVQNNSALEQKSKQILRENKSTMTQNDELECKDIGIQVKISDDKFPSSIPKHLSQDSLLNSGDLNNVILGATYINDAVPLSAVVITNHADDNTDGLLSHNDLSPNQPLLSNKLFSNPGELPTFSNVSPTVPTASNTRYSNSERSSKESQEKSNSLESSLSNKSLGLITRPVGEVHSNSERSSNQKLPDKSSSSDGGLSDGSLGLENKPAVEARSNSDRSSSIKGFRNKPISSDGRLSDEILGFENKPPARSNSERSSMESARDKSISSDSRLSNRSLDFVSKPVGDVLSMSSYSDNFESDASDHTRGSSAS
ncbi:microtubule-associated 10-like [Paramuricea clavata]|uniref:Microtubule-associated 10-like n=1 Tax=Paramuricea clavata TaxID=317549 RepID=A0A6S7I499_PARCT|nr:microtubule-associated 10-like [Paramuricea clavata]